MAAFGMMPTERIQAAFVVLCIFISSVSAISDLRRCADKTCSGEGSVFIEIVMLVFFYSAVTFG